MGGGTTRVGDPSGRDETRKILTVEQIDANKAEIRQDLRPVPATSARAPAMPSWSTTPSGSTKLNYIEMLRDVGRHFSVNRMLSMDSVRLRLERDQELSFLEFNYMILQSYDFVELNRRYGCVMQMGGSDQWGNIVNGIDLGRRMGTPQLYALTCPLLTTSSGAKMGKTAAGAVWLNPEMLKPYDYWQFWRNTEDADVARFLKLFTLLPMAEIARLAALAGSEINAAKMVLATEATALMHGREAAEAGGRDRAQDLRGGHAGRRPADRHRTRRRFWRPGSACSTAFGPEVAKLVPSTSEARRQIKGGGLRVNDVPVSDEKARSASATSPRTA